MKKLITTFLLVGMVICSIAQNPTGKAYEYLNSKGEVYFSFPMQEEAIVQQLSRKLSITRISNDSIYAYANKANFAAFLCFQIPYTVLPHPGEISKDIIMSSYREKSTLQISEYPTYQAYDSLMHHFESSYPEICKIQSLLVTPEDRELLIARIGNSNETAKPRVLLNGSLHGDETVGYILLLKLIDHLLAEYGQNPAITELIDQTDIWILPLLNPDGTYSAGNHTVIGATRGNANNIDLNRNFPNPEYGLHPDNNPWQAETQAMISLLDSLQFVLSATIHGGAEVLNYPFDTWRSNVKTHADDSWWQHICKAYADTAKKAQSSYLSNPYPEGYTNGGDWYVAYGTYQDYANYYAHCRDITMELSTLKLLPTTSFETYWNYNLPSLLNFIRQAQWGIKGIITDSISGKPIKARIEILQHDRDSSHIYSNATHGNYYRPIDSGNYTIQVSATDYHSKTIHNIAVQNSQSTPLNIQLSPIREGIANNKTDLRIYPNPTKEKLYIELPDKRAYQLRIYRSNHQQIQTESLKGNTHYRLSIEQLPAGCYILQLEGERQVYYHKFIKL